MKKAILAALLGAALLTDTAGAVVDPPENTYVADYADVLTADTEQYIIEHNQTLNAATGGAIEVVTVDFLDGMDIADYAYELFNTWGIGDGEADNGLLLLLAIGEENYYAMPGAGIENALTASTLDDYLWTYLEADFAAGDYDAGVRQVFDAFYGWYESYYGGFAQGTVPQPGPDYGPQPQPEHGGVTAAVGLTLGAFLTLFLPPLLVILIVGVVLADSWRYRRYYRRYMMPGMPPPPYVYRPFIFGRPHRPRPPRPPRGPRPPLGGGFGGFGGGMTLGGGAGRRGSFGGGVRSGGFRGGFGGGRTRGGGAGRR